MTITNNRLPKDWKVVTNDKTTQEIVGKTFELVDEQLVRVQLYHEGDEWFVEAQFSDDDSPFFSNSYDEAGQAKRRAREVMRGLSQYDDRVAGYHRREE